MNDLHIDLNDKDQISKVRQRFFTFIGCVLCIGGLLIILFNKVGFIQIIAMSCVLISGLTTIIRVNPQIFKWKRSFIMISNETIQYKQWGIQSDTNIKWDTVKSVSMNFNEVYIELKTQERIKLNLEYLSDPNIQKIKQAILNIGNEKGIEISEKND